MVDFVNWQLPGVFDAIDEGDQGKPLADLFIDDKVLNIVHAGGPLSSGWNWVARTYGEKHGVAAARPRAVPFNR